MSSHVVVVGGGVGGLAVAARLSAVGHEVTVLEQAAQVGGKLGLLETDGYRFDTGPSLLTLPWTLEDTLQASGVAMGDVLDLQRLDPIARYRFADGTWLDADADEAAFVERLESQIHVGAGVQWTALMDRAERMWEASADRVLTQPLRGVSDLIGMARDPRDVATVAPHRSLRSVAREYLSDGRMRMLADRYATYSGSDPRRAPAVLLTVPYAERRWGGWYVAGGLRRIAEVLADRVQANGGIIRTSERVEAIDVEGRTASGVRMADGTRVDADVVVVNADAHQAVERLLPTSASRPLRRRLAAAPRSTAGFVMLLGVRVADGGTAHPSLSHHTVLFPTDYDAEFDALGGSRPSYAHDPTIYVAVADDPAVAPAGHRAVFVLVNAPRSDQVPAPPPGYGDRVLDLLASRGIDLRDRVVFRRELAPSDLADATMTPGGAIYGTSSNGAMAAFLRPPNITRTSGLFFVGGSSHPGGGLPLVMLSAAIVAEAIGAEQIDAAGTNE